METRLFPSKAPDRRLSHESGAWELGRLVRRSRLFIYLSLSTFYMKTKGDDDARRRLIQRLGHGAVGGPVGEPDRAHKVPSFYMNSSTFWA